VLDRPVPALPSLQGIEDHNTREAFRHVYDMLNVRNGDVGDGRDAFVTRKELADNGGIVVGGFGGRAPLANGLQAATVSNWAAEQTRTLSDLENAVRSSPFFNYLQTPIKRLAQEGSQIKTEQTTLQTSFASLARINSVMQAQISTSYVLLEENKQVTADLDGRLSAQWSVKIDIDGYVSGFGLSSTANNSTPFSEFYIAANRFAVGSPGVPRGTSGGQYASPTAANIPFVVVAEPPPDNGYFLNGKFVANGVYMRDAFIQNGSIVRARIGTAQVDTLEVAGNAVTVPYGATQSGSLSLTSTYQFVVSLTLVYSGIAPAQTYISVTGYASGLGSGTTPFSVNIELRINGSPVRATADSINNDWGCTPTMTYISGALGVGSHTVEVYARTQQSGTNASLVNTDLIAIGLRR